MIFIIGLLTAVMILNCLVLILLVLMQLPKKDAGAGLAFGGAATDALFGAGSGNFLTKATKYSAGIFFVLAVILSVIQTQRAHSPGSDFQRMLQTESEQRAATPIETSAPAPATPPASAPNNVLPLVLPATNQPASAPATAAPSNAAPAPKK